MHPRDREIIRLYKSGLTLDEVAPKFELSRQRILQILKREGVTRRSRGRKLKLTGEWLKG